MRIVEASYLTSAVRKDGWPATTEPEIAFCGRSNVGKSTLLNGILQRKGLARVSQAPGRTRMLNFFRVRAWLDTQPNTDQPSEALWVDLPGFGHAQLSHAERTGWRTMVEEYFTHRAPLRVVLLLVDSRRALEYAKQPERLQEELALLRYLQGLGKRVGVVMTKADQIPKHQQKTTLADLRARWGVTPLLYSSLTQQGQPELHTWIERSLFPSTETSPSNG